MSPACQPPRMVLTHAADDRLCSALLQELCGPPVYCVDSLRGRPCGAACKCGLRVVAKEIADLTERCLDKQPKTAEEPESCVCSICQDVFVEPVSLPCGHSFDRRCLLRHLDLRSDCPLCRKAVPVPLPEINYAFRDLVAETCPVRASARAAELRDVPAPVPDEKPRPKAALLERLEAVSGWVGIVSTVAALSAASVASLLLHSLE